MKRLFSGNKSGSSSPMVDDHAFDASRSRSDSSLAPPQTPSMRNSANNNDISPELAPIITLLSAQGHRRYHEGVFMFLQSINSEGDAIPNRKWREVYGVLLGTQLAIWDIEELEKHQNNTESLLNASSKPDYINFTDSSFRAVNKLENSQGLKNVIIVSTTLKNQFLLQYPDIEDFHRWNSAFRLATFEYTSLQEAYTGALLSARGSKLSDIRTILANTKFDYEDWVSVRFGSGMPWKRCFAVIEQPTKKSKGSKIYKGVVSFYKDEKKQKKQAMAFIKDASAAYALYPTSVKMIDHSTMIKLEGTVYFDSSKNSLPKEASVYFMPEQHSAVPGYDTLIRFLVPLLNTFNLYGRPKRLNADKSDMNSLLFGLPVLPHVHYLEIDDLILLASNPQSENWLVTVWRMRIKEILERKLSTGYTGCGSSHGIVGAISSPALNSGDFSDVRSITSGGVLGVPTKRVMSPLSPSFLPEPKFRDSPASKSSSILNIDSTNEDDLNSLNSPPKPNRNSEITQIYEDYSEIVQANETYRNNIQYSNDSLSAKKQTSPYNTALASGLNDPYAPYKSDRNLQESQDSLTKSARSQPSRKGLDDEFDEDFDNDEIFQNGLSGLSMNQQQVKKTKDDLFNPDYSSRGIDDGASVSSKPSKQLPPPTIRVEQASPYTSGRISQQAFDHSPSKEDPYQISPSKQHQIQNPYQQGAAPQSSLSSSQQQPPPPQQQQRNVQPGLYQKPSGPRPDQRFPQSGSQENLRVYQDQPQLQQRPPPQQYPSQQSYAPPQQQQQNFNNQANPQLAHHRKAPQGYSQPPPQQQQRPPQQYQQGPPPPQQQQPYGQMPNYNQQGSYGYNQPPQQQQQRPPPQQQRPPPQQYQDLQQRPQHPSQQRSYQSQQGQPQIQGQRGPPPPNQYTRQPPPHQQGGFPPQQGQTGQYQQYQQRPPPQQRQQGGYPPQQQQHGNPYSR